MESGCVAGMHKCKTFILPHHPPLHNVHGPIVRWQSNSGFVWLLSHYSVHFQSNFKLTCQMEHFPYPSDLFYVSIWERDDQKRSSVASFSLPSPADFKGSFQQLPPAFVKNLKDTIWLMSAKAGWKCLKLGFCKKISDLNFSCIAKLEEVKIKRIFFFSWKSKRITVTLTRVSEECIYPIQMHGEDD